MVFFFKYVYHGAFKYTPCKAVSNTSFNFKVSNTFNGHYAIINVLNSVLVA